MDFIAAVSIFKLNQRLDIWLENNPEEHYSSRIEEIHPDQLVIAMPMSKGRPILLPRESKVWGKVIVNDTVYCFIAVLVGKKAYPLPIWILSMPLEVKKVQLRAFVRVVASLAVRIRILPSQDVLEQKVSALADQPELHCLTKDISGGGIQIIAKMPLQIGDDVSISLDLPGSDGIAAMGEVVRIQQAETEKPIFLIGIKFTDILEKERSSLIKYIFKLQLERRQKGL